MNERDQTKEIIGLSALAFFLLASYELVRPATESLFLEAYTSSWLPWVWSTVAIAAVLVVGIYNRFAARVRLLVLLGISSIASAILFALLLIGKSADLPGVVFVLYVVKDIYVVVLVEVFWSYANVIFPIGTARWIYGLFCACGSVGAMSADWIAGTLAGRYGTDTPLWCVVPLLIAIGAACLVVRSSGRRPAEEAPKRPELGDAIQTVRQSSYLLLMIVLIAVVQIVITLIDFQFNLAMEQTYPNTDERTAVISEVYLAINGGSIALQLGSGVVLKAIGVPVTLLLIPLLLGSITAAFVAVPRLAVLIAAKIASKCLDYSLFRTAKEILYIPLSHREKTQGKALIDMLSYRVAKGGASLLLALLLFAKVPLVAATLLLIVVWVVLVWLIVKRFRRISRDG